MNWYVKLIKGVWSFCVVRLVRKYVLQSCCLSFSRYYELWTENDNVIGKFICNFEGLKKCIYVLLFIMLYYTVVLVLFIFIFSLLYIYVSLVHLHTFLL